MGCLLPYINRVVPCKAWCGWVGWKAAGLPGLGSFQSPAGDLQPSPKLQQRPWMKGWRWQSTGTPFPASSPGCGVAFFLFCLTIACYEGRNSAASRHGLI